MKNLIPSESQKGSVFAGVCCLQNQIMHSNIMLKHGCVQYLFFFNLMVY